MKKIPEWYNRGLCKNYPTKLFYQYDAKKDRLAKTICNLCPVRTDCLQYALDNEETGVWGGLNDADRTRLVRKNLIQGVLRDSSRRNRRREPLHLDDEYPVSHVHISFPSMRTLQASQKAAVLSAPTFPMFSQG